MWPYPRVISHRGGGNLAPENTIVAIETGCKIGIPAVEFDVMLSGDNVPMLMHDEEMERTVDPQSHCYKKQFNTQPSTLLINVNVGTYFGSKFASVCIPTFREVLEYCLKNKVFMNIEIKPASGCDENTALITMNLVIEYYDRLKELGVAPIVSSFSFDALKVAKKIAPHIPRGFLIHSPLPETRNWLDHVKEVEPFALHLNHEVLEKTTVSQVKELGYAVFCYTVNSLERAEELLSWGVDCLCTDEIEAFAPLAARLRTTAV
jgi:glycerophosphoryl diester phosphodiesterase